MMRIRSMWSLALVGAVGASLIAACVGAPEPRLEAGPSVGVAGAASPTGAPNEPASSLDSPGDRSWTRPDATVVLTGSGCELDGDAGAIDPGVLTIEFVNDSFHEGYIKVVRVPPGRWLGELRAWIGMAGGWGARNATSATDLWSSPRAVTSGRWAVVCFKDTLDGPHGINIVRAGVVPIEVR
jgi:hypothetical protein